MDLTRYPFLLFSLSFSVLALSAWTGVLLAKARRSVEDEARDDFVVVQSATLTLLGLIVGFTFSMALGRYDQRRTTRSQRPMPSVRNICAPTSYLDPMRQRCGRS